jgi:hypothetical protein
MADGIHLIRDPLRNLDSAFSAQDRQKYSLRGLLPPAILSIDVLQQRSMAQLEKLTTPLEKYTFLMSLQVCLHILPAIPSNRKFNRAEMSGM